MQSPNKLIFINLNAYPCVVGGLEVFNHYLINELAKTYSIGIIATCKEINQKNSTIHYIKDVNILKKIFRPLLIFFKLYKLRKSVDLVHISFSKAYWTHWFVYVLVKKILGIKYIITIHGGSLAAWKPKWVYKYFFKNAESITGVSYRILEEYKKRSNRNIIYTPPLIPFKVIGSKNKFRKKWNIAQKELVILYVGSIKPLKAVDSLIEAVGLLDKKVIFENNVKVLIAGDGISRDGLTLRVTELGLENTIRFLGNITREEIPELYNLADIYTICSEYEGLPISTLEAFANELPCITSNAPGLNDLSLNNKNSFLFKTRDSEDYADKIELLIKNKKLQKELKQNAYNYYQKHFSYQVLVDSFKKIIDNI